MNGMVFLLAKLFIWKMIIICYYRGMEIALNVCHLMGCITRGQAPQIPVIENENPKVP